jgi:two-component system sensor histidine kinase KdpD
VAQHIAEIFDCRSVALYDAKSGEIFRGGVEDLPGVEEKLKQVVIQGANSREDAAQVLFAPIVLGGHAIGALALAGEFSDGALQALLNLVAIAWERVRTEEAANRADAARQSEEFKSTLLDAIAHEFKTPLTSIKAASTTMLSDAPPLTPQTHELATIIDEEADRLTSLVTEAVRMSQIEAGKVRLDRQRVSLDLLLPAILAQFQARSDGRLLQYSAAPRLPELTLDPALISLALRQLIDNALKYSPPGSPVNISAARANGKLEIRIADQGPGIPEKERERVFEKFYRRQAVKERVPGTGLGLHIAREILRAHGGDVAIAPGPGSAFCITIPVQS